MGLNRIRRRASDLAGFLGLAAVGSAVFLLLAMFMPNWLARTSWSRASKNVVTSVFDSPASYVWLVSLCGLVAAITLAIGLWRRSSAAAVLAAVAFAYGAYVTGNFWLDLSRGVILLDGRPSAMGPPAWEIHQPLLLPVFFVAAMVGLLSAIALVVQWHGPNAD